MKSASYTLHLPRDSASGDARALDRAVLVPDGFSWGAFLFSFLWFFWHRLWLAGVAVLTGLAALAVILALARVPVPAVSATFLLLAILIGLEAQSLRRWTLARRGMPVGGLVMAASEAEAEAKAFERWLDGRIGEPAGTMRPAHTRARPAEPVIGLFPDAERLR
jgi:hypothetical protein